MYNITLIATIHSENGKCNSEELHKILENIKPDVIFDELPVHFAEIYYGDSFETYHANTILLNQGAPVIPLEVNSVKMYRENNDVKIVAVDIDLRHKLSEFQKEISFVYLTFLKNEDYKRLDYKKDISIANEGFQFLNSKDFLNFLEKKEAIEEKIINSEIQKDRIINIYKFFQEIHHTNRENAMLQNIYKYSEESQFSQAVFLIGAEHKMSIMQKIKEFEKISKVKLAWRMYGNN